MAALAAIKSAFGTGADEFGATLFVSHHLDELDPAYWESRLGTAEPEPSQVLDLLVLDPNWGQEDDDDIDSFDFTLPDGVTDYVISVNFDEKGQVTEISMES